MDEPLSNLDAKLRVETRAKIAALQARLGTTTVYVTHDQVEAMTMGRRVAVLRDGVLQQCDEPRHLYNRPANAFVAGFIGSPAMNLRSAPLCAGGASLGNTTLPLTKSTLEAAATAHLESVTLGLRPESFSVSWNGGGLNLEVLLVEELGADADVYGTLPGDAPGDKLFIVRFNGREPPQIGKTVTREISSGEEHGFHPDSGQRLG